MTAAGVAAESAGVAAGRGPATLPGRREASIDVLRALAIAMMVAVHFAENLAGWYGGAGGAFAGVHRTWWLPTGFAAPTFTFLAGVSYRLWAELQRRRGRSGESIAKATVRRGLFLIGLGFAFNVLVWLPEDVFNWDVLTLIGFSLVMLAAARSMPDGVMLVAAVLVVIVAPTMRLSAGYEAYWTEGYFDYEFTIADVALGWLVTGYFPVFPWLAFPLAGYALGPRLLTRSRPAVAAGAALVALAAVALAAWPALPEAVTAGGAAGWTMFPASTAYVCGTLGGVMLALAWLHRLLDGDGPRCMTLVAWCRPLSQHSLTIYLVHHAVHVWPLWAWGLATTGEATSFWQVAMPVGWAVVLAIAFLGMAAAFFRWADGRRLPTAEAAMRWLCD